MSAAAQSEHEFTLILSIDLDRYAYPPSYEQIKAREEKAKEKEAEKAAAKASKGVPFPPAGYLGMGNQ